MLVALLTPPYKAWDGIKTGKVYGLQKEGESISLWRLPLPGLRDELNEK